METGDIRLLPEVTKLSRVELHAYALKRARRIVRETPGDSDTWCDPEEWQSDAIELAHAVTKLLDETAAETVEDRTTTTKSTLSDAPPLLTPVQGAVIARCYRIGLGELQVLVARGDEDHHLAEMIDAFDAYFAACRAKLGHDQVPTVSWETYTAIQRRKALVDTRRDSPRP